MVIMPVSSCQVKVTVSDCNVCVISRLYAKVLCNAFDMHPCFGDEIYLELMCDISQLLKGSGQP